MKGNNKVLCFLTIWTGLSLAGRLELNPKVSSVTRQAGDDKSYFMSCIPFSSIGPVGDSRIRASLLSWKKKQKPPIGNNWVTLGSQQHLRVHVEESSAARGLDLVFRSIESSDEGEYSCEATIDGQKEQQFFYLKVIEPISFEGTNQIQSVEDGTGAFTLICKVTGNPRPKVTWNVRGTTIRDDNDKYQVTSEGLVIKNITQNDKGAYKCNARQLDEDIADFQDMIIQLLIEHEPKWRPGLKNQFYGFISGTSNLTCEAIAEPPATFIWYDKEGQPIREGMILTEDSKSTLVLSVTHDDIFGDYSCEATNKMGKLTRKVTLSEGAKAGIPMMQIAKVNRESTTFTILEHPAELHLPIIAFQIEYKEKHLKWDQAYHVTKQKAISNQYRVDGLMPKTFYHFRARARNEAGYSDYSNMIYLQTSASHAVGELLGSASTSKSVISLAQPFIVLCSILSTTTILSMVVMPVEVFVGWRSWGRIICAQQL